MIRHRFRRFDGKTIDVERDVWLCALDLALRGGWKPRGVEVADEWDNRNQPLAYFPARGQRVSDADARDIGQALEQALTFVSDRIVSQQSRTFGERNTSNLLVKAAEGAQIQKDKTDAALQVLSGPPKAEAIELVRFLEGGGFSLHPIRVDNAANGGRLSA